MPIPRTADAAAPAAADPVAAAVDGPVRTVVDGERVLAALSPSRAGEFVACALRYRFRVVDGLPEPASLVAVRGTVVHLVLERLFDLPAADRTPAMARLLLAPAWQQVLEADPSVGALVAATPGRVAGAWLQSWLAGCRAVLDRYFALEDPRRLEPVLREGYVETLLDSGLLLRGVIDRLDEAPGELIRVVDYKTGRSPDPQNEARALFQMRFYALVLWRTRGVVPAVLQLLYLGDGAVLRYVPDAAELRATERKIDAIWRAIRSAEETGDWRPNPGPVCGRCPHHALCPAYGGTPPPLPPMRPDPAAGPGTGGRPG